jgi:hypothetical protein
VELIGAGAIDTILDFLESAGYDAITPQLEQSETMMP